MNPLVLTRRLKTIGFFIAFCGAVAGFALWAFALWLGTLKVSPEAQLIAFVLPWICIGGMLWILGAVAAWLLRPPV